MLASIQRARSFAKTCLVKADLNRVKDPREALHQASLAARHWQKCLEALPAPQYFSTDAALLLSDIVSLRRQNAQQYSLNGEFRLAAFEFRHIAHIQELTITIPVRQRILRLTASDQYYDRLLDAAQTRRQAVKVFRLCHDDPRENQLDLAFELSYLSRTLKFLRANYPAARTTELREEAIGLRLESAQLFRTCSHYRDAYFEENHLAELLLQKAHCQAEVYREVAEAALRGAADLEKDFGSDPVWAANLYRLAIEALKSYRGKVDGSFPQRVGLIAELEAKLQQVKSDGQP
ncbi:MAG: hypothetical protein MUC35_04370 [Candidatus Margulisbacteria bacterium]|jgi:hypothetical protein|nr:hypothetical protein [Candidatus Margulisiibacteriota bacterium]